MDRKNNSRSDDHTPFQDRVSVNVFFSGAQRRKLLDEIKKSIADGVAVITLTGEEGTGKTMICRMLEKELQGETLCVYLPNTLESFDDVVRVLALKVGTPHADKPQSTKTLVDEISGTLKENTCRLVVVFDQTERMYLATIERIRKMLDRMNEDSILLQIIFSGRKSLLENLGQLEICNFQNVEEKHFSLNPLGLSETYAYLNHCARQRSAERGKNLFTPEAAKKIFSMAQGNLRMTNMLAAKSLDAADSETSFMVLLDTISNKEAERPLSRKKILSKVRLPKVRLLKWQLGLGGAGLLLLLAVVFLFQGEKEPEVSSVASEKRIERDAPKDTGVQEAIPQKGDTVEESSGSSTAGVDGNGIHPVFSDSTEETPRISSTASSRGEDPKVISEENTPPSSEDTAPTRRNDNAESMAAAGSGNETPEAEKVAKKGSGTAAAIPAAPAVPPKIEEPATGPGEQKDIVEGAPKITVQSLAVKDKSAAATKSLETEGVSAAEDMREEPDSRGIAGQATEAGEEPADDIPENALDEAKEEHVDSDDEPVVFADKKKKLPPAQAVVGGAKEIVKIAPAKIKIPITAENPENIGDAPEKLSAEGLFEKRVSAGEKWLAGEAGGSHTLQLMALSAELARNSLTGRFEQQEYRDIADDIYIVEGNVPTVYVYYGVYPDMDSAQQARGNLPVFLHELDPYAVTVENAIAKAVSAQ